MSQWDFGYGREPAEHHEPQYPADAPYPYPEQPGDAGWPDGHRYPGDDEAYDLLPAPYPITYERDGFEGRASLPSAPSPAMPGAGATPPYSPWPDAPEPTIRFGSDRSANPWRPPPPVGQPDVANGAQAWYPGRPPQHPGDPAYRGRPGEAGSRRAGRRAQRDDAWQPDAEDWTADGAGWPRGAPPRPQRGEPWPQGDEPWPQGDEEDWDDDLDDDRGRWLIPAALAVAGAAVGAAIVMFALGHAKAAAGTTAPSSTAGSATSQAGSTGRAGTTPLTLAAARSVLAGYTSANNSANAKRSTATLARVETGGSYAIDAGLYTVQKADGAAPYAAFTPVASTYYIPRAEPAGGPRWFVVKVANAFSANPNKVTSTEYLLFTQAASGGAWQNAIEPYLLAGANAPQVAVGDDGLATAVSATATTLAVAPGQLAGRTAAAIDGTGTGVTVADPGALADRSDQTFWHGKLPTATVTDAHTAATGADGQTVALLTNDGGALVFYTDAADVVITPPAGSAIHLTVPGLYSPSQALSRAGLSYLDQFAADDPPAGAGQPHVVAEYSGLTGKN